MEMENYSSSSWFNTLSFLISYLFLTWVSRLQHSSSTFLYFIRSVFFIMPSSATTNVAAKEKYDESFETITREDVELVLKNMRLLSNLNSHGHAQEHPEETNKEVIRFDELKDMFEEEEPSYDEVYEAFTVFDSNSDGFIDADELHAIVSNLARDAIAYSVEDCQKMIEVHDENGDGRIDFEEFVKFFQSSLCCS